jgi:peptidoglycan/LPS O-acetylase OafA/YrhL
MKGLYPHFWLYFFIGNILAIKYDRLMALCAKWERYRLFNILLTALSTLPFILFASSTTFVNKPNDPVLYMLFLPFPFFLMLSALRQTSLISRILSTRPLVAVGTISYSLYLTHFIVVELLLVDSKIPSFWTISDLGSYVSTAFISSLGLAYIFYILHYSNEGIINRRFYFVGKPNLGGSLSFVRIFFCEVITRIFT